MRKVLHILLGIYGFIANLITYITGIDNVLNILNKYLPFFSPYLIIVINILLLSLLIFYCPILLTIYVTLSRRKKIGTHNIECSPLNFFVYRLLNKNGKLLKLVHCKLYHHSYKLKNEIRKGLILNREQLQERIGDLLNLTGPSLKDVFNLTLSINIKLLSYSSDNKSFLTPYVQVQRESIKRDVSKERNLNHKYIVLPDKDADQKRAFLDAKHYHEHNEERIYQVNSIFNYLFNSNTRYWMSNDLSKDEADEIFFTSSENYPRHYKSMAVFKIVPPFKKEAIPEGLLIFDTENTGCFVEEECAQLMGLIAHLLYEIFLEYKIYEQKEETEREKNIYYKRKKKTLRHL